MNDEPIKTEIDAKILTPAEMTDAIRVLMTESKNANGIREELKNSQLKVDLLLKLILADLENPRPRYDRTSTRKLAVAAYEQSQGFISVENLTEHKVIKDLAEELDKYVGQANTKFAQLRRQIDTVPNPDNMNTLLKESFDFQNLNKKVEGIERDQEVVTRHVKEDQKNINTILETYNGADHPTGPDFDEISLAIEEAEFRHNDLVQFLKGVFTSMKLDAVAKCVDDYKIVFLERIVKDK